ncbi:oxidoreductase [bacterium]|nr:oxidoreductase [bacterium]
MRSGQREENRAGSRLHRVQSVRHLTGQVFVLRVDRLGVPAVAGQCATLGAWGSGLNREYSMYGGQDEPWLDFLVREVEDGQVSPRLKQLAPGDPVEMDGPYGRFVIEQPGDRSRRYLFVATGVGIAPFHSYLASFPWLDYHLIHGVRLADERYDRDHYDPERYTACLSLEAGGDYRGRVTDYLRAHPADPECYCYLCGNSGMVAEASEILRGQGVNGDHLFTEAFF